MNNLVIRHINNNLGSALMLSILIMAGVLVVTLGAADLVVSGLRQANVQVQSTKAFFGAEAGAERALWEVRKNGFPLPAGDVDDLFNDTLGNGSSYQVNYSIDGQDRIFTSIGGFNNKKRSVEVTFTQ